MGILDAPPFGISTANADRLASAQALALQGWFAALANRNNAPARIWSIGDSITEGTGSTTRDTRYISRFRDSLRQRFPSATVGAGGGVGFLAPYFDGPTPPQPAALTGTTPGKDSSFGTRRAAIIAVGQTYTYTITGTSVDVRYVKAPSTGTLSITIDGGAATTINTAATLTDGNVWNSGALTAGTHTVAITSTAASVYFTGIFVYNGDEAQGIHMNEAGHYGITSTGYFATGTNYWATAMAQYNPHLVTIAIGVNDYQNSISSATFKTNVLAGIAAIRTSVTVTKPSIVLVPLHQRGDVSSPAEPWQNYVKAMYDIAAADTAGPGGVSGVTVADFSRRLSPPGSAGAGDPYGLISTDRVHPTDKGHGVIGEALAGFVSPR